MHPEDSNQYFGNGLLPLPTFLMTHFSGDQNSNNAQPSHQYDRPYPLLGPGPQYNSHRCQNDNRNLPQHDGGFRSRRNHSNDRGTFVRSTSRWGSPVASEHNRRHVSRQNPSVYHERVNARLQPNSCDPSPRYKSNENLPDTRGVKLKKLPFSDVISTLLQVDIINLGQLSLTYFLCSTCVSFLRHGASIVRAYKSIAVTKMISVADVAVTWTRYIFTAG